MGWFHFVCGRRVPGLVFLSYILLLGVISQLLFVKRSSLPKIKRILVAMVF